MEAETIDPSVDTATISNDINQTTFGNATDNHTHSMKWKGHAKLRKSKVLNETSEEEEDEDDDDSFDIAAMTTIIEDRWSPRPTWSIAPGPHDLKKDIKPLLTSRECYLGLVDFFQHAKINETSTEYNSYLSAARLSVATESSSHPTGIRSLNAQPWVYAGGGLGNVDECLSLNTHRPKNPLVHVCLAGGTSRDSLTFASACVPAACSAEDVFADDFPERVATAGFRADDVTHKADNNDNPFQKYEVEYRELLSEYVTLHKRIAKIGEYLSTGWVCGEYTVDWQPIPSMLWCGAIILCTIFTIFGTYRRRKRGSSREFSPSEPNSGDEGLQDNGLKMLTNGFQHSSSNLTESSSPSSSSKGQKDKSAQSFWSAWDANAHLKRLTHQRPETACLDGLKVWSMLWIIGAHIMAIQSSTGAGYINPEDFFPPRGTTTTFFGQLLFSSRFAVDTFLCISGYLAAYVLQRKLKISDGKNRRCVGILKVVAAIVFRVIRILPLYMCCLGFWMFLAPHMGSGPFWYQWEHYLEPCRQLWWTNLLFVNNIWPLGAPTEATCFYHSWYLAVDVQLFCLFAPWLVMVYQSSPTKARKATLILWLSSVIGVAFLAYTQEWSVNSFDGYSVAIFNVEGYAKPHVRAQSYLAGIFVAFWPRRPRSSTLRSKGRRPVSSSENWTMILVLAGFVIITFVTVTGAYARRACTFGESPFEGDDCGSLWSFPVNFLYTAFGRAAWSVCVALLLHLCLLSDEKNDTDEDQEKDHSDSEVISLTQMIQKFLGWSLWTPFAHLSFGAYLIHPIVIYVWFFGGREKINFRLFVYLMEFCSITVVTFAASFLVTLLVEFPLGILLRPPTQGKRTTSQANGNHKHDDEIASLLAEQSMSKSQAYGSLQRDQE